MTPAFIDLAVAIILASVFGLVARFLRQPALIAYILSGCAIAIIGLLSETSLASLEVFGELGITLLLFLIGLELNYSSLKLLGKKIILVSTVQICSTALLGYLLLSVFNLDTVTAAYLALAFVFSSTVIVVRILSEKKDLNSLHGKFTVGTLLLQDVLAIFLLVALSTYRSTEGVSLADIAIALAKGILLFVFVGVVARRLLEKVFTYTAKSEELLFITSLAWVFLVTLMVSRLGFSLEIAGLLAGVSLSRSAEHYQIASRVKVLRDFFVILFFVGLGSSIFANGKIDWLTSNLGIAPLAFFGLLVFILVIKPLTVLVTMGALGYEKRTSFKVAITHSQLSEFSLILVALGVKLNHLEPSILTLVTLCAVLTMMISAYGIEFSNMWFGILARPLRIFERRRTLKSRPRLTSHIKTTLLIGCHRLGQSIISHMPGENLLIVDFDPNITEQLKAKGYDTLFGDMANSDFLEAVNVGTLQLIISTSPDTADTLHLLRMINLKKSEGKTLPRLKVIVRAEHVRDAKKFYAEGADYVLLPHITSGHYLGRMIASDPAMRHLSNLRRHDVNLLSQFDPIK